MFINPNRCEKEDAEWEYVCKEIIGNDQGNTRQY